MAGLADFDALDAPAPAASAPQPDYAAEAAAEDYQSYLNWKAQSSGGTGGGPIEVLGPDTIKRYQTDPPKPPVMPASLPATATPPASVTVTPNAGLGAAGGAPDATRVLPSTGSRMDALDAEATDGSAPKIAPVASSKKTGPLANLAAGGNEAAAGFAGLPVDAVTGAINLVPRAINAAAGTNIPTIKNPVGGSDWWKSALGLIGADPRDVVAGGAGQAVLRGIGSGAVGALLPMGAAGAVARGVSAAASPVMQGVAATMAAPSTAGTALAGGVGGATGATLASVVPDQYKPVADLAGQFLGGGVAALGEGAVNAGARAVGNAAKATLGPIALNSPFVPTGMRPVQMTDAAGNSITASPWQADLAAGNIARAAGTTPQALGNAISGNAESSLVPGSVGTMGQVLGNSGLLSEERRLRTLNPQPFADADAARNTARQGALATVGGPAAHAEAAGQYIRRRLDEIDATTDAAIADAQRQADEWMAQHGAAGTAADYGQAIREGVESRRAPVERFLAAQERAARERLGQAAAGLGREMTPLEAQRHGAALREAIHQALLGEKSETSRLFNAIDPESKLRLVTGPMRAAGRAVRNELVPESGLEFTPRVEHWVSTLEKMPPTVSFQSIKQTRQGIGEAMRARDITPTELRQLRTLRDGLDNAIEESVAGRAGVEAPHVENGGLVPTESTLGRLAQERADWYARQNAAPPPAVRQQFGSAGPAGANLDGGRAPGGSGTASPASGGVRGETAGRPSGPGTAGVSSSATEPASNVSAADAAAYAAARAQKVAEVERFRGSPSDILAQQNGAYRVPDSVVASRFWNAGSKATEDAQSLIRALGSREAAIRQIGDAAAYDLRTAKGVARPDGTFDAAKFQNWLDSHRAALDVFPELRQRFGSVQRAQQELDAIAQRRAELDAAHPIAANRTNADVAAQYWRPGPNGTEAVQRFARDVGTDPAHVQLLSDTAAQSLEAAAMKNGAFDEAAYNRWMAGHEPALSAAPPELLKRFQDFGAAQRTVEDALAAKAKQMKDYQDSAARFYLDRNGEARDPQVAIGRLMSSDNPGADAAQLMRTVGDDEAARAGIQRNLVDWIMAKARSTANAGTTQEKQIAKAALDRVMNDPKSAKALGAILNPDQIAMLRAVVEDMDREAMSINATKIPGSPGTAADAHAIGMGESDHGMSAAIGAEIAGELLGHATGMGGIKGALVKGASVASALAVRAMRAAGMTTVADIETMGVLNPEIGRLLLLRPGPAARPAILTKLAGLIGNLAVSGVLRR